MVTGLNSEITAATDCSLTSNAKVQWMFTTQSANGMAGSATADLDSRYNIVILGGAEEGKCGGNKNAC